MIWYRIVERLFIKEYNNLLNTIIIITLNNLIIIIITKAYNKAHALEIRKHHHLYNYHKHHQ